MELPDNIRKLLLSHNHEDRAIGISLLEKIPEYVSLFTEPDNTVPNSICLKFGKVNDNPCTRIITDTTVYWVNTGYVYRWELEKEDCHWTEIEVAHITI